MKQFTEQVRRNQVKTWSWLHVNDAEITLYGTDKSRVYQSITGAADIEVKENIKYPFFDEDAAGFFATAGMRHFIDQNSNSRHYIRIPRNYSRKEPVLLSFYLNRENSVLMDDIVIEAEEGSRCTVIFKYTSENGVQGHHCGRTRVILHPRSEIKLIKAQLLGSEVTHTDIVGGTVEEGANIQVILAEMGSSDPLSSCNLVLKGEESSGDLDSLYMGDGTRSLDFSYRIEHRGRSSLSNIRARGVLLEQSKKMFRDTLDFISGAAGSKGREEENVLMLGPEVRNISVPTLLCGEENVEGEHASSSGRPDERILFYLMTRGIDESEAMKILAEAAFTAVLEQIPNESLREDILNLLRASVARGGRTK